MTWGFVTDVPAPAEFYDALHAEVAKRTTDVADGLLLHVGRATDAGFQVMEVWESREHYDRYNAEVVGPALAHLLQGQAPPPPPALEEFEPRGLVVPGAGVLV